MFEEMPGRHEFFKYSDIAVNSGIYGKIPASQPAHILQEDIATWKSINPAELNSIHVTTS
jgi:hypothetical protein